MESHMKKIIILIVILLSICPATKTALGSGSIPSTFGWYQIPNTTINSVCAATHGFPEVTGAEGCPAIESWSGGVFDSTRNRLIVWGGGHAAYLGNELYAIDLNSLTIQRITNPGLPLADCQLAIANGTQAASRHTYDGVEYMPNVDRMFVFGGAIACSSGGLSRDTWTFNFATMTWQQMSPSGTIPHSDPGVVTAYDPNTGKIFLHDLSGFYSYTFSTNSYTQLSSASIDYHLAATIDPKRKKFVMIGAGSVYSIDISSGSSYALQTLSTTGGSALISTTYPGIDYDPVTDRVVAWNGGDVVYSLNLDTNQWTTTTFSGGPGAASPNQVRGTHGRWRHSSSSGVFILVNETSQNAYAFRLTSGSGSPPPSDSTPPSTPSNFTATPVSSSQISLSWTASTDNIETAGYFLYRCQGSGCTPSAQVATATSVTSYSDTGLSASTIYVYRVAAFDAAGNVSAQSSSASATTQASTPPTPSGTGYSMPSLTDEKNTYTSWGWTWSASTEPNFAADSSYTVSNPDIHYGTEGDDLWTYLMMYRRTGQKGYLDRALAWARYFKQDYRTCVGSQYNNFCYDRGTFGADHLWGWGLIALYEYSGDIAALGEAENIGAVVEGLYAQTSSFGCLPTNACTHYGLRQSGRHLLLATRLAEVTHESRWITLRDKILNLLLASPQWDAARGMYFVGDSLTDEKVGAGAYASGARIQSAFQIGVLAEAFFHVYRTTGRQDVKDRMVAMAHFVDQYGLDPTYQYTGSWFGIVNGKVWHIYSASQPVTFWDPVYTTSLVNTLVWGYKYTGDISLYNRAKYFFNRGTKSVYGSPTQRTAADNVVGHFVDTVFDSSTGNFYLAYNKGELQYTYALFEKPSASPSDTIPPVPPTGLTAN
jgi:hypothetical protein